MEELLLQSGFVRVMVDCSSATCRRAQPSRMLVGCMVVFSPFSSFKTLNSFLDHVGYLFLNSSLRQKFRVPFEEFDVFVSVCAISNFEHVHHGGRGGEGGN